MKRKIPKLFALFLILAMLMASVAYAAPSPERDDDDDDDDGPTVETPATPEVEIGEEDVPLVELPSVEVSAPVRVKDGQATVKVDAQQIANAIKAVANGEAARINVTSKAAPSATKLVVALAKEALKAVVEQGSAEVQVSGSVGQMTLPNAILASVMEAAGGKDVSVSMNALPVEQGVELVGSDVDAERVLGGSVTEIDITAGSDSVQWDGGTATVYLPTGTAAFEEGQTYSVLQIEKSGSRNTLSGECVKVDGQLRVVTSVQSLGTFVVLAGSEGASASADPTAVRSPLFR